MSLNSDLFVRLSYRLKSMRNVAVLMYLLENGADVAEVKNTLPMISYHGLSNAVSYKEVRKAVEDLIELGLVTTRIHANTKTHFTVDRAAVLAFLSKPVAHDLPGLRDSAYPFLEAWRTQPVGQPSQEPVAGDLPIHTSIGED